MMSDGHTVVVSGRKWGRRIACAAAGIQGLVVAVTKRVPIVWERLHAPPTSLRPLQSRHPSHRDKARGGGARQAHTSCHYTGSNRDAPRTQHRASSLTYCRDRCRIMA